MSHLKKWLWTTFHAVLKIYICNLHEICIIGTLMYHLLDDRNVTHLIFPIFSVDFLLEQFENIFWPSSQFHPKTNSVQKISFYNINEEKTSRFSFKMAFMHLNKFLHVNIFFEIFVWKKKFFLALHYILSVQRKHLLFLDIL